jgi:aspartyl aminopeptidase
MSSVKKTIPSQFIDFVNKTGSPYHSVAACKAILNSNGFQQLHERIDHWDIKRGGKYYITRNHSEIFAFAVGGKFEAASSGMVMVGAHTDSPCLRVRPNSNQKGEGLVKLGVAPYGGGLWYTWFDRPLGMAGKVVVKGTEERLLHVMRPMCIIPSLAIHLQTAEERKGFEPNLENHLMPILCSVESDASTTVSSKHPTQLLNLIAKEIDCDPKDITDVDICLMDSTPSGFVGLKDSEFISSPRIDNLLSTFACISAITEIEVSHSPDILVAASFDHEEVGSTSATGADSRTVSVWIERILESIGIEKVSTRNSIIARSILISADCAHAIHPNYSAKHQAEHKVNINGGVVFKTNANQRYATTCSTTALGRSICEKGNVKHQDFVVKNDSPCGSTIGPLLSAMLGIRTIDCGAPQWAMHSCRETCGANDVTALQEFCKSAYENFRVIDNNFKEV